MPSKSTRPRTRPPQPRNSRIIFQDDLRWDPRVYALWKSKLPRQRLPVDRAFDVEPKEVRHAYKCLQQEECVAHAKFWRPGGLARRRADEKSLREWRKIQIERFTMRGRSPKPRFYNGPEGKPASPSGDGGPANDPTKDPDSTVKSNPRGTPHPESPPQTTTESQVKSVPSPPMPLQNRRSDLHQYGDQMSILQHMLPYRSGEKPIPLSPAGRARIPVYPLHSRGRVDAGRLKLEEVLYPQWNNANTPDTDLGSKPAGPSLTLSLGIFMPTLDVASSMLDADVFEADHASATLDVYNGPTSSFRYEDPEVYDKEREMDKGITSVDFSRAGL